MAGAEEEFVAYLEGLLQFVGSTSAPRHALTSPVDFRGHDHDVLDGALGTAPGLPRAVEAAAG
jgi:hypothetical protein